MKEFWNDFPFEEREREVWILNEIFNFPENYKDAAEAAWNVRVSYENDPDWFGYEVTDLDAFQDQIEEFINEEYF